LPRFIFPARVAETPAPPQLPDSLPGLDLHNGLERISDPAVLIRLLKEFHLQYADSAGRLRALLAEGETDSARQLVHTLKGVSGNVSAMSVYADSRQIDDLLRRGEVPERQLVEQLEADLATLGQSIASLDNPSSATGPGPAPAAAKPSLPLPERLAQLAELLSTNSWRAGDAFTALRNDLPETQDRLALESQLARLDFPAARQSLDRIVRSLELDLPSSGGAW
jgi:HPt (histidine-containing phosphotransfer) domain-containing protein